MTPKVPVSWPLLLPSPWPGREAPRPLEAEVNAPFTYVPWAQFPCTSSRTLVSWDVPQHLLFSGYLPLTLRHTPFHCSFSHPKHKQTHKTLPLTQSLPSSSSCNLSSVFSSNLVSKLWVIPVCTHWPIIQICRGKGNRWHGYHFPWSDSVLVLPDHYLTSWPVPPPWNITASSGFQNTTSSCFPPTLCLPLSVSPHYLP